MFKKVIADINYYQLIYLLISIIQLNVGEPLQKNVHTPSWPLPESIICFNTFRACQLVFGMSHRSLACQMPVRKSRLVLAPGRVFALLKFIDLVGVCDKPSAFNAIKALSDASKSHLHDIFSRFHWLRRWPKGKIPIGASTTNRAVWGCLRHIVAQLACHDQASSLPPDHAIQHNFSFPGSTSTHDKWRFPEVGVPPNHPC